MWNKLNKEFIIEGKYYLTCVQKYGEISNVQKMRFTKNLWFTEDGMYAYYQPTHFKEV